MFEFGLFQLSILEVGLLSYRVFYRKNYKVVSYDQRCVTHGEGRHSVLVTQNQSAELGMGGVGIHVCWT